MKKNLKPILIFILILILAGGLAFLSYWSEKIPANPDGTIGNTAGNLNNGGLFCEHEGRVYFANPEDSNCLYSMTVDETDVQKLYAGNVCNILTGGEYVYYFMREPVGTSLDNLRVSHAFFRSELDGEKTKILTKDVVIQLDLTPSFYQPVFKSRLVHLLKQAISEILVHPIRNLSNLRSKFSQFISTIHSTLFLHVLHDLHG